MNTKWILENFTNESSYTDLVLAINKAKLPVQEIKSDFKFDDLSQYNKDQPVIFLGSIGITSIALKQLTHCFPVAYCNQANYLCTKYMSHFGSYLFNDRYAIVSLSELKRHKFFYYGVFGKDALIFLRPDSGQKPFQAQLMDLLDLDTFIEHNQPYLHDLVVISSPKNIRGEWRFVVSKYKEIIGMSTYRYQGQTTKIPSAPQAAIDLVNELLKINYYPDSVFVMDICEDNDGKYWLLELNSFSSAGLYECNKDNVVKRVSEIAECDWKKWRINEY